MEKQKTWVRLAVNGHKIRAGDPFGWRCFVGSNPTEISLKDWSMQGEVIKKINVIPGTLQAGDRHGLVYWIDIFGICTLKNGVLEIELGLPTAPPSSYET